MFTCELQNTVYKSYKRTNKILYACVCVYIYIYMHIGFYIYIYLHTHVHKYRCMHDFIYTHTHRDAHIHTQKHTHTQHTTHTHTHTHMQWNTKIAPLFFIRTICGGKTKCFVTWNFCLEPFVGAEWWWICVKFWLHTYTEYTHTLQCYVMLLNSAVYTVAVMFRRIIWRNNHKYHVWKVLKGNVRICLKNYSR